MSGFGAQTSAFNEFVTTLDANNSGTSTTSFDIRDNDKVCFSLVGSTATLGTAVVTLECSLDETTWFATANTITGDGVKDNIDIIARFVRLKITTAEGTAGTALLRLNAK